MFEVIDLHVTVSIVDHGKQSDMVTCIEAHSDNLASSMPTREKQGAVQQRPTCKRLDDRTL